jgi:hypothetical protein
VCASENFTGGTVTTHRINGDWQHIRDLDNQSMVIATRPLYQPHTPHTVCGNLAEAQRGHVLRDGASRRQFEARRIRVFDFDFFFLGTATVVSLC